MFGIVLANFLKIEMAFWVLSNKKCVK